MSTISLVDGSRGSRPRGSSIAKTGDSSSIAKTSDSSSEAKTSDSSSISSSGESRGSSSSISNMVNRLLNSDGDLLNCVDWSVDWGHNSLGRVGGEGGVMHMGSLHDLLDGVDLVGSGNRDSTRNSHIIGSGDVLVDNDLTSNSGGDMDGHINVVLLHIDLGDDVGGLGSDPGVGPHGSKDLLLDHGISRGRSQVDRCWGDGSKRCRGIRYGRGSDGQGHLMVLGGPGQVGDRGLGDGLNTGNRVLVAGDNLLSSSLDNLVSNNPVLDTALN